MSQCFLLYRQSGVWHHGFWYNEILRFMCCGRKQSINHAEINGNVSKLLKLVGSIKFPLNQYHHKFWGKMIECYVIIFDLISQYFKILSHYLKILTSHYIVSCYRPIISRYLSRFWNQMSFFQTISSFRNVVLLSHIIKILYHYFNLSHFFNKWSDCFFTR